MAVESSGDDQSQSADVGSPGEQLASYQAFAADDLGRHLEARQGSLNSPCVWARDPVTGERVPANDAARQLSTEQATAAAEAASAQATAKAEIIRANTEAGKPWWRGLPLDVLDAEELAELPAGVRAHKESRRL